jgi:glycerol-3-phosphate dehydrogenase
MRPLVHDLLLIVPTYSWWESPFYGIGLKVYDVLAGKYGFGKSRLLSREETLEQLPAIRQDGLKGGVAYHDGQFDDTRLLTHLMATAVDHGATVLNYTAAIEFLKDPSGFVNGVTVEDRESGERFNVSAKVVVNATGIFADEVRRLAQPDVETMVSPSQGIHLVFDRSFLRGGTAIMVPHTSDGRLMFALPWHEHTIVGTTDTPIQNPSYEPRPFEEEVEFILDTAGLYLSRPPKREDILSIYAGIRPLVKAPGNSKTSSLSRDHTVHIDDSGLLTIVGGKWTTYRHMAEDCVNHAINLGDLRDVPCVTANLPVHGYHQHAEALGSLAVYGSDAVEIRALAAANPELATQLNPELPYIAAEVVWAARNEMARTLEDVLARRTRALFLNAAAAITMAPRVARILAMELKHDQTWARQQAETFTSLAAQYLPTMVAAQKGQL